MSKFTTIASRVAFSCAGVFHAVYSRVDHLRVLLGVGSLVEMAWSGLLVAVLGWKLGLAITLNVWFYKMTDCEAWSARYRQPLPRSARQTESL